uniref:NADH:ubiquinone reductase (H(+)-translocating) n=1 Tax=Diapriidae sp. ZJUH_2016010 TaxID=2491155 RepID=A0A3Q8U9Z1_9HYME|nr:NADH dehydrogenase subunit 5 [Diapriidae sp. ZJUH_2016010]
MIMIKYYFISLIFMFISMLMFILGLMFLYFNLKIFLEWMMINMNCYKLVMLIYLDYMSFMFISLVLLISSLIILYCIEYMMMEDYKNMFLYLMILFVISMIILILSINLFSMILGWDGLGLISYLLVIYYNNNYSFNSGMLTFLMNRLGDIMLMISVSLMFMFNTLNYMFMELNFMMLMLLLMICSMTKSAQMPFSLWLPSAMAAPTPVSSLVHSSTLVTAGIYLMIRMNFNFMNLIILNYLIYMSILTMMLSGMMAMFIYDLKKIIALSTLSQLGLMFTIYCLGFYNLSFFHLLTHAMFKSLLFMCSGVMIHLMKNFQDIRMLGMLMNYIPFTMMMFNISNLSLCGLYFFSGFYSKDIMLESMVMFNLNYLLFLMVYFSTMLTMMYSIRLIYYSMNLNFKFMSIYSFNESKFMNFSMMMMMLLSILGGSLLNYLLFNYMDLFIIILNINFKYLLMFLLMLVMEMFYYKMYIKNKLFLYFFMSFMFLLIYMKISLKKMLIIMKMFIFFNEGWLELMFIKMNNYYFMWIFLNKFIKNYKFDYMMIMLFMMFLI